MYIFNKQSVIQINDKQTHSGDLQVQSLCIASTAIRQKAMTNLTFFGWKSASEVYFSSSSRNALAGGWLVTNADSGLFSVPRPP